MAWETPKTDWAPTDGVQPVDMNRIEGNTIVTARQLSTNLGVDTVVTTGASLDLMFLWFDVPTGSEIVLEYASYVIRTVSAFTTMRLKISSQLSTGGTVETWQSADNENDLGFGDHKVFFQNSSGSTKRYYIDIDFLSTDGSSRTITGLSSFLVHISIRPTPAA